MEKKMKCMVCGNRLQLFDTLCDVPLRGGTFRDEKTEEEMQEVDFYICDVCGHGQIPYKVPDHWYDTYQIIETDREEEMNAYYSPGLLAFYEERIKRLSMLSHDKENILDIGSGIGSISLLGEKFFERVEGVEPSVHQIKIAEKKGVITHPGYFENVVLEQKYSAVFCVDLLEHLAKLDIFLNKVKSVLKPDGVGYIMVPNGGKIIGDREWCDVSLEHISYFNTFSLSYVLQAAGLRILSVGETHGGWWLEAYFSNQGIRKTFSEKADDQYTALNKLSGKYQHISVWGAGNKGSMFVKKMHGKPGVYFEALFDNNEAKWGKYIPGCDLKIMRPSMDEVNQSELILISALEYKNDVESELYDKFRFEGKIIAIDELGESM